ncbi:MAG TPA: leukotriene A4 hydrolase C-terminal domain-containing protein, partial [Saprospiraceae bacterium]|nr:leukotriene A4 hydrolase C-terminal domain-containing protein [Saprospiraceae bacterium]
DLKEMDPDEAMTDIAYEKGKLLLRYLEERLGRKTFDQILKRYFKTFEFHSNTSEGFIRFLDQQLKPEQKNILDTVRIWVYEPGLPDFRPGYDDAKFKQVDVRLERFLKSSQAADLMAENWTTHEWLYFLTRLPDDQDRRRCQLLDQAFKLSSGKNAEIQFAWLEYAIQNSYGKDLLPQIEHFLVYNGRRKFLMPIYKALIEHQLGTEAARIYQTAKAGYHPISDHSVEKLLEANNLLRKGS